MQQRGWLFLLLQLFLATFLAVDGQSIADKIRNDNDLSEFLVIMQRSPLANITLQYKPVTIFAPINEAFQTYGKEVSDPNTLVPYHMASVAKRSDQLGSSFTSLNSELPGNLPLWITHITGTYHHDIFVNNAQILVSQSNIHTITKEGDEQIVHKIDQVLVPTKSPKNIQEHIDNPTAYEFLEKFESLDINPFRLRSFREKMRKYNKQDVFKTEGGHTFFIPEDEGFKPKHDNSFDGKIVDGHVIPRKVLFTKPTKKDVPYQTLANGDNNVRVVISFAQETRGSQVINYVKSHTLLSDGKVSQGVVLSEIVKANIPVKNGVVHIIQKPLMIVDSNVKELLEEKDGGILNQFVRAINDADYKQFFSTLERSNDVTLFAPCNSAWRDDYSLNNIIRNKARFRDILSMHLVVDNRLYVDKIINSRDNTVATLNPQKRLYFNVFTAGPNRTVTVEGGGVNATVLQADLAATNGVIHIIDRVLGVPHATVYDKLHTDPSLNSTFVLGNRAGFNRQLNDTTKKFTYFVPRNQAWDTARIEYPSAIKQLFMPEYHFHATSILERHLVIADEPYTMEKIKHEAASVNSRDLLGPQRGVILPTIRGQLEVYVEERDNKIEPGKKTFTLVWKGRRIPVYRHNVACTNGIIHVIDAPFLQESDIQVSSASISTFTPHLIALMVVKWFFQ